MCENYGFPLHITPAYHYIRGVTLCNYGNKWLYEISGLDPGAEPGASTKRTLMGAN